MTAESGLTYRDELSGPQDRVALHRLLHDILGLDISPILRFGVANPTYRALSYLDESGACVANAATFTLPLVIRGNKLEAMGIQSVATRPEWRRRGLSHDLLQRALRWCDANAPLTFLMTSIPRFYAPMGFRILPQFAHAGAAPATARRASGSRRLNLFADGDRLLLVQILRQRTSVSEHFAVNGLAGPFVLNLFERPDLTAWYLERRRAVVVTAQRSDGMLCVVDVAAAGMPGLDEILAAFDDPPEQVEVHFPPDRLGWTGIPTPARSTTALMVRGDLEPLGPFMLPDTASF